MGGSAPFAAAYSAFPDTSSRMTVAHQEFEPECRAALDALRAALIELYASVGADPGAPQDVARRFHVNKTLTWNISKVMASDDPLSTIPKLPGASAFRSFLAAVEREGAGEEVLGRVRRAVSDLDDTVARHVGDRATLELVVDGIASARGDHLELSRKLVFRGNSGLWGVQAKTRLMSVFMAPNAKDATRIDIAIVRGYIGLRRLRSSVRWPIFQISGWGEDNQGMAEERWEPLEPGPEAGHRLPLLRSFSTLGTAAIEESKHAKGGTEYLWTPGPIGNAGAMDCFLADCSRSAAAKHRTEHDTFGEFGATISVPTERLVFDLIVHEDLAFALQPTVHAISGLFPHRSEGNDGDHALELPVSQTVARLPGQPPSVATSDVPRYSEIAQFVYGRMGWTPSSMRGCRLSLLYPPFGSTVFLRFGLPAR